MRRYPKLALPALLLIAFTGFVPLLWGDYKQAVAYYNRGQFDKAIQELKPDLDANPDWEFGHRLVGLSYLQLKNNALAVSSLTRAIELKSTAFSAYYGLAQAYVNMQKYDQAVQILLRGESYLPKDDAKERYKFYHLRGTAYFKEQKYAESISDMSAALRISGDDWTNFYELGFSYFQTGRYDEAIQALQRASALKPGEKGNTELLEKAYFKKGLSALANKQYADALSQFKNARDISPRDGYIHYNMAEAYLFLKNYAEAEKALGQALEIMPKSVEAYLRLGLVYEKQKKWDASISAYQKANDLSPSPAIKEAIARVTDNKKAK
jgi:tetratricopeptide (TPR) repeat protein